MINRLCILLLIGLIARVEISAQNPLNQFYEIDNLDSKELIKGVVRDNLGFVWVATDDGILRYDGKQTQVFNGLKNRYAKEFLLTRDNRVWVIHDTGLELMSDRVDSVEVEIVSAEEKDYSQSLGFPKSIYEDRDSVLWIGESNAIVRIDKNGLKRYSLGPEYLSISYHHSFSFTEDAFGHLWVAPYKGALLSYDEKEDRFVPVPIDQDLNEVSAIATIRGDHILISGREGLLQIKIDSNKDILDAKFVEGPANIADLETVGNNHVYIATWDQGLYYWDFEIGMESLKKIDEVSIEDIVNLSFNPRSRELWIAGGESIGVLMQTQVKSIKKAGKVRIESLSFDRTGGVYFSSGEPVHHLGDLDQGMVKRVLYSSETFFGRIYYQKGRLWVGDVFGSIYHYDVASMKETSIVKNLGAPITYIMQDSRGDLWFSGGSGVVRIDTNDQPTVYQNVLTSNIIREDRNGSIVCGRTGTDSLVYRYSPDDDRFIPLEIEMKFSGTITVNDLEFDRDNNLWLATDQGLFFAQNKNEEYPVAELISLSEFQEDDNIRAIAISEKYTWLAYPDGLVFYDGDESMLFNKDSGLPSNILKERGLKFGPKGELFIYTAKGLAKINEEQIHISKSKPPVIRSISVNGEKIDLEDSNFTFPYNSRISCDFMSLSFPGTKLEYQTRIIGYDEEWSKPSTNSNLSILGFSEGNYTLQIRAKRGGKQWSDPVILSFRVSDPWYLEWWSVVMLLGAAILIIILFVQIYNRNLIRQKRKLHGIIERRTREIQDQKNEIIEQQERLITQKEELLSKNQLIHDSDQARNKAEVNFLHLKEKQLQEQIEYKNKQITTHALNILQKNESLREIRAEINSILEKPEKHMIAELRKSLKMIDESFKLDKDWEDFKLYFEQIYTGFYAKLKVNFPDITNTEMRHCALIRLNLPISECASILGISPDSVKVSRSRLRKKLGLVQNQSLSEFIMGL